MKKRTFVRIVSFLTALLLVVTAFLCKTVTKNNFYKENIKYSYSRSFEILNACLNNITVNLQKAMYASTSLQMSKISTEIFTQTVTAKQALAEFPKSEQTFDKVNKFLSQAGNYVVSLSERLIGGTAITNEDYEKLSKLQSISVSIAKAVTSMHSKYNNKGYWDSEITGEIENLGDDTLANDFILLEEAISDYPTLLYDGPYSDHAENTNPKMLEGANEVSEAKAREALNKMFGNGYEWKFREISQGKIPAYEFYTDSGFASVTLDGGYVISYRESVNELSQTLDYKTAVGIAERFLKNNYEGNFSASYYYADNGVCVINFAALQDNVICYADLIKVGVSMSGGNVVFFEASGYLANHYNREIGPTKYSYSDAKNIISERLKIMSYATALIPSEAGERLCYEFLCRDSENREVLLYINAENLQEEEIFILLKTDGGTLVK